MLIEINTQIIDILYLQVTKFIAVVAKIAEFSIYLETVNREG